MASSRNSRPGDVRAAVADAFDRHAPHARHVAVALSGGVDSVVLLDALQWLARTRAFGLAAVHVHHGLSPNADAWEAFCAALCAQRGILLAVRRVEVERVPRTSLEANARRARYAALAAAARELGADAVALAHHQDDQAETLLLQLTRGAGPHGLAAMPMARHVDGVLWLRPLLDVTRATIDAYRAEHRLAHVEDESNANPKHRRNALRHTVVPSLAALDAGYPGTLARAAAHQAEAARLLDELAFQDAAAAYDRLTGTLDRGVLTTLTPARARNVLRWLVRELGLLTPSSARLAAMLEQLTSARVDARVRLVHGNSEIGIHRGRIVVHAPPPSGFERLWSGESVLALPHGDLAFVPAVDGGLARAALESAPVLVRSRSGGERLQLDAGRPRRALKSLLHAAGVAPWERGALPLVFCGDALAAVPGIGVDIAFRANPGDAAITLDWRPHAR